MVLILSLAACATKPFLSPSIESATFIERAVTQTQEVVEVAAAVPGTDEVVALTGLDLYSQGIQPIWIRIKNQGSKRIRLALWSIDDEYFSPLEVAWKNRRGYSKVGRVEMERWFLESQMPRFIPPGESRSGYVYTHIKKGTKGFNLDVYASGQAYNFTFFVPVPGFRADYTDIDVKNLYSEDEIQKFDLVGFRIALESYACCSTDVAGREGDPFNLVLVGTELAVRRALLRSDWEETESNNPYTTISREHRYQDRPPDGIFRKTRPDGSETKELRLWRAPMRVKDEAVWMGQASYNMEGGLDQKGNHMYRIDPDIDDARMFVVQNFWYSQSLAQTGVVGGIPAVSIDSPRRNFRNLEYFTNGQRIVMFVSENPVALDEVVLLPWERLKLN